MCVCVCAVVDLGITNEGFQDFACKAFSVGLTCGLGAASVHCVRCVLMTVLWLAL